ncbi:unnamed protein product [Calypogeia fissa]
MPTAVEHAPQLLSDVTKDYNDQQEWTVDGVYERQTQSSESDFSELDAEGLILKGLRKGSDAKEIPPRFLYDDKGSEIYEAITRLEEYYPFKAEDELFDEHVENIVSCIPEGSVLVDLGCGSARKTARLLNAVITRQGRCRFVGIDVSSSFLDEAACNLMLQVEGQLSVDMVQGDYMGGLREVRKKYPNDSLCLLWLGSSVGNLRADEAISFFKDVLSAVDYRCRIFVAADMWKKAATLYAAYHDREGVTEKFIRNGMKNALRILGYTISAEEEMSWVYEVEINSKDRFVEMYLKFPRGISLFRHNVNISPGERVLMEISRKFTVEDIQYMAQESGLHVLKAWRNEKYGAQMLLSDLEALVQCWQETDTLFQGLSDWTVKPIDLRHPFCFYYGHVSSFMKLKLFPEEPASDLDTMFSRGIDPGVLDPTQCHEHPEIPAEWPKKEEIMAYVRANREKVLQSLATDMKIGNSKLVAFILEHERMHQETLIYMMAQERKATFERTMTQSWQSNNLSTSREEPATTMSVLRFLSKSKMIAIEAEEVVLGADASKSGFLWDNEYPQFHTSVKSSFFVSWKPTSIGEFYRFVLEGGYDNPSLWDAEDFKYIKEKGLKFPATWSQVGDEFYVHEFQATHHWSKVKYKPVFVSLSEAQAFCRWVGARIMTEAEYQRILDVDKHERTVEQMRTGGWEWTSTPFMPFPGFKAMPEYPEYSTDFFDGNHFVLKGSSPATNPSMLRDSFRNYYQKQYPYVFAKFRCCKT